MAITLQATQRIGDRAALLALEQIPAVYYGKGADAVSIAINAKEFGKVWKDAGETTAVMLAIGGEKIPTVIHDMQRNPITGEPTHIDFLIIDMKKELEVNVPIEFEGTADAEKNGIGTLVKVLHEIEVKALPNDLPHAIHIDVTNLATLDDQIHVRDLKVPAGVTVMTDGDEVVALIAAFKEEVEETVPVDLSAIEVEQKGKKDEEEATA